MRSLGRSLGRGWRSLKMASCCLRARFSRARSRCRLKAEKNAEMQAIKPLITSPTILGASREIQCFLQIRTFGDGQHCPSCITRTHRNGEVSYHHAGLVAVVVHESAK